MAFDDPDICKQVLESCRVYLAEGDSLDDLEVLVPVPIFNSMKELPKVGKIGFLLTSNTSAEGFVSAVMHTGQRTVHVRRTDAGIKRLHERREKS